MPVVRVLDPARVQPVPDPTLKRAPDPVVDLTAKEKPDPAFEK